MGLLKGVLTQTGLLAGAGALCAACTLEQPPEPRSTGLSLQVQVVDNGEDSVVVLGGLDLADGQERPSDSTLVLGVQAIRGQGFVPPGVIVYDTVLLGSAAAQAREDLAAGRWMPPVLPGLQLPRIVSHRPYMRTDADTVRWEIWEPLVLRVGGDSTGVLVWELSIVSDVEAGESVLRRLEGVGSPGDSIAVPGELYRCGLTRPRAVLRLGGSWGGLGPSVGEYAVALAIQSRITWHLDIDPCPTLTP